MSVDAGFDPKSHGDGTEHALSFASERVFAAVGDDGVLIFRGQVMLTGCDRCLQQMVIIAQEFSRTERKRVDIIEYRREQIVKGYWDGLAVARSS